MVVIGLGANLEDKLANLRRAYHALKCIPQLNILQVSPVYLSDALLPEAAPADWNKPYLNAAIRCETTLTPQALLALLKNIELTFGRKSLIRHWGPRILDLDILVWDDIVLASDALALPHKQLCERPFALWPLADVAPFWKNPEAGPYQNQTAAEIAAKQWGSRFDGSAPFRTRQINQRLTSPQLVGIVNLTPDSFSDGGHHHLTSHAVMHAQALVEAGADIIDMGAESTAPHNQPLDAKTEWARLAEPLAAILNASFLLKPKISIDTYHPETAKKALAMGIDWINDVTGFTHPAMRELAQNTIADCLIMHALSIPASRQHMLSWDLNPYTSVAAFLEQQINLLLKEGISKERIIIDPGIGFGKHPAQSLTLIKAAPLFKQWGVRVMMGHSRKSFLSLFTNAPFAERDLETAVISLQLANQGIDYLRVHNVYETAQALKVAAAFCTSATT